MIVSRSLSEKSVWPELFAMGADLLTRAVRQHGLQDADAADVVQEVWVEAALHPPTLWGDEPETTLRAWLRRVLVSKVINLARRRAHHRRWPLQEVMGTSEEPAAQDPEPANRLGDESLLEKVWSAAAKLPAGRDDLNCRVFELRFQEGWTTKAIAAATGLSRAQVRDRLRRCVARLRKALWVEARASDNPSRKNSALDSL